MLYQEEVSLQVEICPKKDDVAMLVVISLGYDSTDITPLPHAHGQLNQNLTVRYSGSEHEIDRKLFR